MFDATEAINDIIGGINDDIRVYDESCYNDIVDELQTRYESGEIEFEDAQLIADYAADIYLKESSDDDDEEEKKKKKKNKIKKIAGGVALGAAAAAGGAYVAKSKAGADRYVNKIKRGEKIKKKLANEQNVVTDVNTEIPKLRKELTWAKNDAKRDRKKLTKLGEKIADKKIKKC